MHLGLRLFLPFAAGYFLSYLLRNVNAVIAPELTRELGVSAADLGLLTSAYLLTFSAFQLPLGVLLDRYGPRRVEATLLLIAAAGSAWFALGTSLGELAMARALIGLGVCACLMAAFKAFSLWFPVERLPSLNAAVMVAGGLGALTATTPLAWVAPMLGRQGLFMVLAALAVLAALGVYSTPDKPAAAAGGTLGQQLRELGQVLRSREFWRFAPMTATGLGSLRRPAGVVGRAVADAGGRTHARGRRLPPAADDAGHGLRVPGHRRLHRPAAPARAGAGPGDGDRQRPRAGRHARALVGHRQHPRAVVRARYGLCAGQPRLRRDHEPFRPEPWRGESIPRSIW